MSSDMEAEGTRAIGPGSVWPALPRVLPGLFPPRGAGLEGAERRVVLALLFALVLIGTAANLFVAPAVPVQWLGVGWLVALASAALPWHREPRASFGAVALALNAVVALLVASTGGSDSPYSGLFYLAVMIGAVVAPPLWLGLALGLAAAGANLLPLAYTTVDGPDALLVRSGLLVVTALFGSWLVTETAGVAVVAETGRHRLGEKRETSVELRRAQSLRQDYLSVVAHELRNPLVAIGAAARVVAKDVRGRSSESIANGIVQEVRHALELLDGLSDVSSLESGRLRIVLGPTELSELVRTVAHGLAPDHELVLRGTDRPIVVLADEGRVGQVLRNLIGNAAKYAPPGTAIEVTVGLSPDRRKAVVAVRDHGPGIPPLERQRLFERFSRLSTAGTTRGSGLGLYISRGIIRDHQGDLTVDWPAGGGTVFSFTLPLLGDGAAARGST